MVLTLSEELARLERFDTPTVCNALEMIDPVRRRFGYTNSNVTCLNDHTAPRAGLAFTATMRSLEPPVLRGEQLKAERLRYYEYMSTEVEAPKICVMQDLDGDQAGRGPFFGEFNVRIHRSLGFSAVVTDGSIRDVTKLPNDVLILSRGLRPSHSYVHVVDHGCQVNVFGMVVRAGDIVHADRHGAVTFPVALAGQVSELAEEFMAAEAPILDACREGRLTFEELTRLYMGRRAIGDEPSRKA